MVKLGTIVNAPVRITQIFGDRPDYYKPYGFAGHEGLDLAAGEGTIITTATNGVVSFAGNKGDNYGNYVLVWDSDQNVKTLYAHLQNTTVTTGQNVSEGDMVGHMGKTGKVTGVHLHFGIMRTKNKKPDQLIFLAENIRSDAPLNPNNGYKGWEDPRNDSLFDWYRGGYGFDQGNIDPAIPTPTPPSAPGTGNTPAFDAIYKEFYPGWPRVEAEADFYKTYGGDLDKLKIARGWVDPTKKKIVKKRPKALQKTYSLNPHWSGLTLQQINQSGIALGRVDILSGFLGIPQDQKLQSGQLFKLDAFPTDYYPNSSEWLGFLTLTNKGTIGNKGDYYIKPEYAGLNLFDIRGKYNLSFRTDILGEWLGIGDKVVIYADDGLGTQGFPNINDTGSGEVQAFFQLFTTTPPREGVDMPDIPEEPIEEILPGESSVRGATITVRPTPSRAKFYIDGLYFKDLTPANKGYPVIAGSHEVRIEKNGYRDYVETINIEAGEQKVINITLEAETEGIPTAPIISSPPSPIAIDAIIKRLENIERILTEAGRL